MIELYQAEWCPFSSMVRERLTELGLSWIARPVEAQREQRVAMREHLGVDTIPVLVLDDGEVLAGDTEEILAGLDRRYSEPEGAEEHRRAAAAHR